MAKCLSELELERELLHSAPERSRHLESCARCTARQQAMRQEGEDFRRVVFRRTQEKVAAAFSKPRPFLPSWRFPVVALACVSLLALLLIPRRPPKDYVGVKGAPIQRLARETSTEPSEGQSGLISGPLQLFVYREAGGVGALVQDGEAIPAASQLRFRVRTPGDPCRIWILSVDSGGEVSRLFPAKGEEGGLVSSGETLPGGVALDGHPGPERLFAVCSQHRLSFKELERAAKDSIPRGEAPVRQARELPGFDNALQTTVLVEKTQ